jgi:hypothetical protein
MPDSLDSRIGSRFEALRTGETPLVSRRIRKADTGAASPLISTSPRLSYSNSVPTSRRVFSGITVMGLSLTPQRMAAAGRPLTIGLMCVGTALVFFGNARCQSRERTGIRRNGRRWD